MDWRQHMSALIPGLEGVALAQLWRAAEPRTAAQVHARARTASLNGIRLALERLATQGVVTTQRAGNVILYALNAEHLAYPALRAALDLYHPHAELRERLKSLVASFGGDLDGHGLALAIYGSVARGDASTDSDIDLLLVADEDAPIEALDALEARLRSEPERWTGNRVHLFRTTRVGLVEATRIADPIAASWLAEAETVYGPDVRQVLRHAG